MTRSEHDSPALTLSHPTIRSLFILMWTAATLAVCQTADAHKASDSYLKIKGGQSELVVRWDIAIKDLELIVGVDTNQDGDVTWGELKTNQQKIAAHALSHLNISADGTPCDLQLSELKFTKHSDGGYAVLLLNTGASGSTQTLAIQYSFLFDADPTHRGLVLFENEDAATTQVLSPSRQELEINIGEASFWSTFVDYTKEGVWHIWIGFDHILFLICLLLPAVLVRKKVSNDQQNNLVTEQWRPVERFRPAFFSVLKIVTVFTIAHSITLWLAVMEFVTLPSQWIESAIAFSIIVTAVNNLFPIFKLPAWMIAFAFGLIHGFGFANVLLDLGLSSTALAISLFGFNVGVELGQMAIVAVFLPLAFLFRRSKMYDLVILKLGSIVIAIIAAIWMIERIGNFEILGF